MKIKNSFYTYKILSNARPTDYISIVRDRMYQESKLQSMINRANHYNNRTTSNVI